MCLFTWAVPCQVPAIIKYAMRNDNETKLRQPAGDMADISENEIPKMLCIVNDQTDAYFNMAAEEYLIRNFSTPVFMLYQNEPSVIIGRHQCVDAEINTDFVREKQIKIVRRNSGGGAVYQDYGNLNLSFMETGNSADFDKYAKQMQHLLSTLGIHAQTDARRALYVDGLKISGSAQFVRGDKTLYHATLLFSTDLINMASALEGRYADFENMGPTERNRYVKSVRSRVTNIRDYLPMPMTLSDFKNHIFQYFLRYNKSNSLYRFSREDIRAIENLRRVKYATSAWNLQDGLSFNQKIGTINAC